MVNKVGLRMAFKKKLKSRLPLVPTAPKQPRRIRQMRYPVDELRMNTEPDKSTFRVSAFIPMTSTITMTSATPGFLKWAFLEQVGLS